MSSPASTATTSESHRGRARLRLRTTAATAPTMLPALTKRVSHMQKIATAATPSPASGSSTAMTPKLVATPLPPRNPRKGLKLCPTTAATPHSAATGSSRCRARAMTTASTPLRMSKIATASAGPLPSERSTLVAPLLPLPTCRISTPRERATQAAAGTAPMT